MKGKDFNRLIEGVKQFVQIRSNEIPAARKAVRCDAATSTRTTYSFRIDPEKTSVA